ncbi:MAG: aldo/keto reductase [Pseudonocardiaceae bacterium]
MTTTQRPPTSPGGDFHLGGDLPVRRLGYGCMQLTGPGHWDYPTDPDEAQRVLRRAVDSGVNHLDTADAYGPETVEHLIRKALHPYPADLVIATKGGFTRQGPNRWAPVGRPEYLRQCVEMSLRRLALDRIDLYYLHRIDPQIPLEDQLGVLADLQREGKLRHLGLSQVGIEQIRQAGELVAVAAVQNKYNLDKRIFENVLRHCETTQTAFVPYAPLGSGRLLQENNTLAELATNYRATSAQLALAWLLQHSPVMLPIPGTSSTAHLDENLVAITIQISPEDAEMISAAFPPSAPADSLPSRESTPTSPSAGSTSPTLTSTATISRDSPSTTSSTS